MDQNVVHLEAVLVGVPLIQIVLSNGYAEVF